MKHVMKVVRSKGNNKIKSFFLKTVTAKVCKGMITIKKRFIEHGFSFLEKICFDRATDINYGKPFLICIDLSVLNKKKLVYLTLSRPWRSPIFQF